MTSLLPTVEIETASNPTASVIWLHGLGDDGHGWSQVVPALRMGATPAVRFIFPHAPKMPVAINNGYVMPAWYDVRAANLNERADIDGVRRSQQQIEALVAREKTRGVPARHIVLAGFSQGGAIALYTALRHPERLAAVVALSTYVVDAPNLVVEASAMNRDLPIFMGHGTHDPVVALAWAEASRKALDAGGWKVEWHTYAMEHSASPEEIVDIAAFLRRVLA